MRFYDFDGSEYKATIWANDKEEAIRIYKEKICSGCKICCKLIDIDTLQKIFFEQMTKLIPSDDIGIAHCVVKETLYEVITSHKAQVFLIDSCLD